MIIITFYSEIEKMAYIEKRKQANKKLSHLLKEMR